VSDLPEGDGHLRTAWHPLWVMLLEMLLPPEMRLVGLKPEDRLVGLSEGEQVLAFPDAALRALAPAYIAMLPAEVQAAIRARLAR
jgi:hypothetical protein